MDDHEIDQRLRRSGAAMRETAPDEVAIRAALTRIVGRPHQVRWIVTVALAGVAAATVFLFVWMAGERSTTQPPTPADSPVTVPRQDVETAGTDPLGTADPPLPLVYISADALLHDHDWDGTGGSCITITGHEHLEGMSAGGCIDSGRFGVQLVGRLGDGAIDVSVRPPIDLGTEATAWESGWPWTPPPGSCDSDLGKLPEDGVYELTCGEAWERQGYGVESWVQRFAFPATPSDPLRIVPVDGEPIALELVATFDRERIRGFRPVGSIRDTCIVVTVAEQPGWHEACRDTGEAATFLFVADGQPYLVEDGPGSDDLDIRRFDADGSAVGCETPVGDTLAWTQEGAQRAMITGFACSEDLAAIETADVSLAWGDRRDGSIRVFEQRQPPRWTLLHSSDVDCLPTLPCHDDQPAASDVPSDLIASMAIPPTE